MTVLCLWLRVTDVTYFLSNGSDQEAMNVVKCSDWSFLFLVVLNLVERTSCDTMNKNADHVMGHNHRPVPGFYGFILTSG